MGFPNASLSLALGRGIMRSITGIELGLVAALFFVGALAALQLANIF
jgi:hypothetical protein